MSFPPTESGRSSYVLTVNWPAHLPGGVNEVVLSLAHQIERLSKYHAVIAVTTWDYTEQPQRVRGSEVINLRLRDPLDTGGGIRVFAAALLTLPVDAWKLFRLIRERRVEVFNAHFPGGNVYALFLLKWTGLFKGKILLSFHGADVTKLDDLQGCRRVAWRVMMTRAHAVTACSRDLARLVKKFTPRARVVPIHNGVDLTLFNRNTAVSRERRSILHVGKYEHKKSQDVLLRAFHLLLKSIPAVSLVLVGANGPMLQQVRVLVSELGLEERVEIRVDVPHEHLPQLMHQADLFVLPSRLEPFGIVLLEAGAANLPVVATHTGGILELIEDGVTGLLVAPDNIEELEAAMRDLLINTERANRLSGAWHDRVLTTWSWERTAKEYLALLGSPLANQVPKPDEISVPTGD